MIPKITASVNGYNEEARAECFFQSVSMFDEIVCFDRGSTDRTVEIAIKYGAKINRVDNYPLERTYEYAYRDREITKNSITNEWFLSLTYADIVHPMLYVRLCEAIEKVPQGTMVIGVPWVEWLFGYQQEHIPYCHYFRPVLRRTILFDDKIGEVHQEVDTAKYEIHYLEPDKIIAIHHLTFYNLRHSFIEQLVRYSMLELRKYSEKGSLKNLLCKMRDELRYCIRMIKAGIKEDRRAFLPYVIPALMLTLYRGFLYYLNILLLLLDQYRQNNRIRFLNSMVAGLPNKGQFHRISIFSMLVKLVFFPFKLFWNVIDAIFLEAISLIISVVDFFALYIVMIWNQCRKESVEEYYLKLKQKILKNEL